jgi:hypothetical protein
MRGKGRSKIKVQQEDQGARGGCFVPWLLRYKTLFKRTLSLCKQDMSYGLYLYMTNILAVYISDLAWLWIFCIKHCTSTNVDQAERKLWVWFSRFQMSNDPKWSRWKRLHVAVYLRTCKIEAPRGDDSYRSIWWSPSFWSFKKLLINLVKNNFRG